MVNYTKKMKSVWRYDILKRSLPVRIFVDLISASLNKNNRLKQKMIGYKQVVYIDMNNNE